MSTNKIFAIGDIHGCDLELKELIELLPLDQHSTLIFLGDYIDRGPNTKAVIEQILKLKSQFKTITLLGNHEAMLLEFLKDPSSVLAGFFILNGGSSTLASYASDDNHYKIPDKHLDFFYSLKFYHESEKHFFVHAGLPDVEIKNLDVNVHLNDMLWIRKPFFESSFNWGKIIVHGHTPQAQIEITKKRINLDTGCVFNGSLSAIEVNSGKTYQVKTDRQLPVTFLKASPEISRVAARFSGTIPVFIETPEGFAEFLTVNYNQFGMLILERSSTHKTFEVGQILRGKIGPLNKQQINFVGQVVRHQRRGDEMAYGIKMTELLNTKI
jgi:serine/threonine protein phosphatase 1